MDFQAFPAGHPPAGADGGRSRRVCGRAGQVLGDDRQLIFAAQSDWSVADPDPVLREMAEELGLDTDDFTACMADPEIAERVTSDLAEGAPFVRGTPTFIILHDGEGSIVPGALPVDCFVSVAGRDAGRDGERIDPVHRTSRATSELGSRGTEVVRPRFSPPAKAGRICNRIGARSESSWRGWSAGHPLCVLEISAHSEGGVPRVGCRRRRRGTGLGATPLHLQRQCVQHAKTQAETAMDSVRRIGYSPATRPSERLDVMSYRRNNGSRLQFVSWHLCPTVGADMRQRCRCSAMDENEANMLDNPICMESALITLSMSLLISVFGMLLLLRERARLRADRQIEPVALQAEDPAQPVDVVVVLDDSGSMATCWPWPPASRHSTRPVVRPAPTNRATRTICATARPACSCSWRTPTTAWP